jgi:hypothetical protein
LILQKNNRNLQKGNKQFTKLNKWQSTFHFSNLHLT